MQHTKKQDTTGKDVKKKIFKVIKWTFFILQFIFMIIGIITDCSLYLQLIQLMTVLYLGMMCYELIDDKFKFEEKNINKSVEF